LKVLVFLIVSDQNYNNSNNNNIQTLSTVLNAAVASTCQKNGTCPPIPTPSPIDDIPDTGRYDNSSEFAGGVPYALSGQIVDERDYINECSRYKRYSERLDLTLEKSIIAYEKNLNWERGNAQMQKALPLYDRSMATCTRTNHYFVVEDHVLDTIDCDWETKFNANYLSNKELVDKKFEEFAYVCESGAYCNCGLFNLLAHGDLLYQVVEPCDCGSEDACYDNAFPMAF